MPLIKYQTVLTFTPPTISAYGSFSFILILVSSCYRQNFIQISSLQSLSRIWLLATPWTAVHQGFLFITNSQRLLKLMSIMSAMPSNHLILCRPFSSHLQSFPAPCSFQKSWFFTSGGQSIGASASTSVLPMNIQDWFPLRWTVWSSCSQRNSQESSPIPQFKSINSLVLSFLYSSTLTSIYDYIALTRQTFVGKVMFAF